MTILASLSGFEGYASVIAKRPDMSNINYPGVLVRIADLHGLLDTDTLTYKPTAFTVDTESLRAIGGLNDPKKKSKTTREWVERTIDRILEEGLK